MVFGIVEVHFLKGVIKTVVMVISKYQIWFKVLEYQNSSQVLKGRMKIIKISRRQFTHYLTQIFLFQYQCPAFIWKLTQNNVIFHKGYLNFPLFSPSLIRMFYTLKLIPFIHFVLNDDNFE